MSYASTPKKLPYRPIVALGLGVNAAIFLSLIEYWEKYKVGNDMVYKSIPDIYIECGLSRNQQESAIAKLLNSNLIYSKIGRKNIRHFRIHQDELNRFIHSMRKSDTQICEKAARKSGRKPHTITLSKSFITHDKYEHPKAQANKGSPKQTYKGSTLSVGSALNNRYKHLRKDV